MVCMGFRALKTPEERLHRRRFSVGRSSAPELHLDGIPIALGEQKESKKAALRLHSDSTSIPY